MKKILVCEDEDVIRDFVVINLKRAGYEVVDVDCGEDALMEFNGPTSGFDIILLDVMMPGIDGFSVCKSIRERNKTVGIIMLSAKTQEIDKVGGLMLGADDYMTKPFSPSELVARVDAVYRRVSMAIIKDEDGSEIASNGFILNTKSRTLKNSSEVFDLTQVEYLIMEYFFKNINVALERNMILDKVWGTSYSGDIKIVDVNIRRLRMKLEKDPSSPLYIQTVWGYGYKWQG